MQELFAIRTSNGKHIYAPLQHQNENHKKLSCVTKPKQAIVCCCACTTSSMVWISEEFRIIKAYKHTRTNWQLVNFCRNRARITRSATAKPSLQHPQAKGSVDSKSSTCMIPETSWWQPVVKQSRAPLDALFSIWSSRCCSVKKSSL
jgi:hypothetical protein